MDGWKSVKTMSVEYEDTSKGKRQVATFELSMENMPHDIFVAKCTDRSEHLWQPIEDNIGADLPLSVFFAETEYNGNKFTWINAIAGVHKNGGGAKKPEAAKPAASQPAPGPTKPEPRPEQPGPQVVPAVHVKLESKSEAEIRSDIVHSATRCLGYSDLSLMDLITNVEDYVFRNGRPEPLNSVKRTPGK